MRIKGICLIASWFFFSLIFALGCAEVYVRAFVEPDYSALNRRYTEPYVDFGDFRTAYQDPDFSIHGLGYEKRGLVYLWSNFSPVISVSQRASYLFGVRYPSLEKKLKSEKRIFVVGGSAALGDGVVTEDNRFPLLLEKALREHFADSDVHVYRAAVRAFISSQERIALELYVFPYKPDLIVFLDGYNDINQIESVARPGDPYNQGVTYARYENPWFFFAQSTSYFSGLAEYLTKQVVERTIQNARQAIDSDSEKAAAYGKSSAAVYLDNLRAMAKRCGQEKTACLFFFQPARIDQPSPDTIEAGLHLVSARLARESKLFSGQKTFDLSRMFADHQEYFADPVHLNDKGQKELVALVAKEAEASLRILGRQ